MIHFEVGNVVIVVQHSDGGMWVYPEWECEATEGELQFRAAQRALEATEEMGCGYAYARVYDFRRRRNVSAE